MSGAGLATLAAGLQSHRPDLLDGDIPFDERTMIDDHADEVSTEDREPAKVTAGY